MTLGSLVGRPQVLTSHQNGAVDPSLILWADGSSRLLHVQGVVFPYVVKMLEALLVFQWPSLQVENPAGLPLGSVGAVRSLQAPESLEILVTSENLALAAEVVP